MLLGARRAESAGNHTNLIPSMTHILELISRLSVAEKILFNPPRSKVPLHAITKGLGAFPVATKTQQRLDDNAHALVATSSAKTGLVEDRDEGREEHDERGGGDDGTALGYGGKVGEEEDLRA